MKPLILLGCFIICATLLLGQESNKSMMIENSGFEAINILKMPESWDSEHAERITVDNQIRHSGQNSVKISHDESVSTTLTSAPVKLQIGHLYKVSGWLKTEQAVTSSMDRYPTSVAACMTMASFPFTNHSPALGGSKDWQKIEVHFIATTTTDRIRLHLGFNGAAKGNVWFDDISLEKVNDITSYIPPETVTWFDQGYRYDDRGWIFVHIEGDPYRRGYQYGHLIASEMAEYMNKLAIEVNKHDPGQGWDDLRFVADAFMLRKYETEFLTEMRGIADGANKAGQEIFGRKLDVIDVVTMNSAIDIEWARYAMPKTPNPLSGKNFMNQEDEINIPEKLHKCSSFLANKSSTTDGRIVFGQIFMWGGYTGPHWNVICDVVPTEGNRLVYQTFPGGIHSGADFYINAKGIMIGETTVSQTPFNPDGSPQSNRIRKAAQYAESIDDVVDILTKDNNGMYANDWLIGDTKTDEIAVLLLGTYKHKLWRSSNDDFYGDTKDFYWCNNNNKDPEVRKEYIPNADNAPFDLIFTPWNRDIAFNEFYRANQGKIDAIAGVNVWASAPINRPHACDGKITTSEMAENLVFMAHAGKVTLREKFVGENRRIPDLPGATPRLSLGYSIASPVFITEKLKALRGKLPEVSDQKEPKIELDSVLHQYQYDRRKLWFNTMFPATERENWLISGTAAYWRILDKIPENQEDVPDYFLEKLADLNCRYLYVTNREGSLKPLDAQRVYDKYNNYQVPRIKGTYLLHQLRLKLGNSLFSQVMNAIHNTYREKDITTQDFIRKVNAETGQNLDAFIRQWLSRADLPVVDISGQITAMDDKWQVDLTVNQNDTPYDFLTTVKIEAPESIHYYLIEVKGNQTKKSFVVEVKPERLIFNALRDVPLPYDDYFTWSNYFDDFHQTKVVYGTRRQIEANHTLALRFNTVLADRYTEELNPVIKDSEITESDLKNYDLIVLGNPEDNSLMADLITKLEINTSKNRFKWMGTDFGDANYGLFTAYPNPFNASRSVYLFSANSALQLYNMTHKWRRMPSWAIFKQDEIIEKGFHDDSKFVVEF